MVGGVSSEHGISAASATAAATEGVLRLGHRSAANHRMGLVVLPVVALAVRCVVQAVRDLLRSPPWLSAAFLGPMGLLWLTCVVLKGLTAILTVGCVGWPARGISSLACGRLSAIAPGWSAVPRLVSGNLALASFSAVCVVAGPVASSLVLCKCLRAV